MHTIFAVILLTASLASNAMAQHLHWDNRRAEEVDMPLSKFSPEDRNGVSTAVRTPASELHATRLIVGSVTLFAVQPYGDDICSPTGNCTFWILDNRYRIVLTTIAQMFEVLRTLHNGKPDILTSMHGSAFESGFTQWRFNGHRYRKFACADRSFIYSGNVLKRSIIFPEPCD